MQLKFFSIPASGESPLVEELNRFLRTHRVISVQKEITQRETAPCWRICVEYLESTQSIDKGVSKDKARIDYKQILSEKEFAVFSRLRDLRKKIAENEAIPVYAICTNEQLAEMARNRCSSLNDLKKISGFGEAKEKKYGIFFLEEINRSKILEASDETNRKPDR
jgi:superfamily II DNA helicase RecQ